MTRLVPILLILLLATACAKQTTPPAAPATPESEVKTVKTMVTGIDMYDSEQVLVLNTALGPFIIGPDVLENIKMDIHEHVIEARDRVMTIDYVEESATDTTIAHNRIVAITINGNEYRLH